MKERKRYIHKWEERILNFITLGGSGIFIMLATLQVFMFFYFSLFGEKVQADVHTDKEKIYLLYQVDGQYYESDVTEIVFHPKETEVIWYLEKNPKDRFTYTIGKRNITHEWKFDTVRMQNYMGE